MVSGEYTLFKLKRHQMKNTFLFVSLICLLLSTTTGCYAHGPWRGKVIDAETKQPIEGAAVVAVWEKNLRGPAGMDTRFLDARETLTDKEGKFEIPSFRALDIFFVREITGPKFTIFKPGYGSYPSYVANAKDFKTSYETIFEAKEDIIELPVFRTKEDRLKAVNEAVPFSDVPRYKVKKLMTLINSEMVYLGLPPYKEHED